VKIDARNLELSW